MVADTLIFIPTYNEHENVENIAGQILDLNLNLDILFMDDNSPDGTGDILNQLSEKYKNISVVHRTGKLGIGSAHIEGINLAYDKAYKNLITMDCDFTHSPEYIKQFLDNSKKYDIVIGSRYLQENSLNGWNAFRKILTKIGHFLTSIFLEIPFDATAAYRLYRLDKISKDFINLIDSRSYSFFFESLFILYNNNYSIKEISTVLPARVYGHSKMQIKDALHSVLFLVHIYLNKIINKERFIIAEHFTVDPKLVDEDKQGWNEYWEKKNKAGLLIYDLIAVFYRKYIIKRSLNYFIYKYYLSHEDVLHAGCGSGQVDSDINNYVDITALDISPSALKYYVKVNNDKCKVLHGSIFNIPAPDKSFDGIYNLGVMEHFTEEEIDKILRQFRKVLKDDGKIILFWPHEYGVSVLALKLIHFIINDVFRKNIKFHPDEITRIKSKDQARMILLKSGFEMEKYYFGIKDIFTQAIIIGKKK
jgi:dolichol-phosphate mannosyltransferase